jgi:hypothetical protein
MLSYNLMSVFRHAVMRQKVHHTLSTLHHQVLAVGALWDGYHDQFHHPSNIPPPTGGDRLA